jgi:hypothetical protein
MTESLRVKLQRIRTLKSKGAEFEVQAMYQVLDLERQTVLWQTKKDLSFFEVLNKEKGLCTPARFKAFKKATTSFNRETINRLGVPSVCLLAQQNEKLREKILDKALQFRTKNGSEPTYQYIAMFLRGTGKQRPTGPTPSQLRIYNELLKDTIRGLGGRVPPMPTK